MVHILGRIRLLIAVLVIAGFAGSAVPARARDNDNGCARRIQKAEQNLQNAERKHGGNSRQVRQRREQLEQARAQCRGRDRDRDRDHDRDHDRDRR